MTYGVDPLAAEAADPRTAPARLAELAAAFPHLHPLIDANPACYPALRDWMRQIAAARQPAPAQQPGPAQQVQQPAQQQPETPQQHRAVASPPSQAAHRQMFGAPVEQGLLERAYTPVDDEAAARRKRRRILFIVLGIVLTLLLAAGTTFGVLYATGTVLGGRSPEQAAQRFALGAGNADPLAVLGATAPSEADHLRAPIERLLELDLGPAGTGAEAAAQLRTAISLQLEEAEYGVEPLGEGIALVTPVAGTAVLDGDPGELAAVLTALAEPALRAGLDVPLPATEAEREATEAEREAAEAEGEGAEDAAAEAEEPVEPDVAVQDFRERAEVLIAEQLPATIDLAGEDAAGLAVVVVEEGTGWYASPLLTAAELRYRALGDEAPPRGEVRAADELPRYETPQLAAEALATGIVAALRGEGLDDAAAALSLPERRLVEIYGEALIAPELPELDLQVDALELSAREPTEGVGEQESQIGGSVELLIDGKPLTIGGGCSVLEEPVGDPDAEFQQTERIEHCLADRALLDGLGSDEWTPVALPEGDGWRVGGLATAGDVLGIVVERYTQLVAAGEVARLESSNDVDRSEE